MITVWVFFRYTVIKTTNFDKVFYICIWAKTERSHECYAQKVDMHIFISVNTSTEINTSQIRNRMTFIKLIA